MTRAFTVEVSRRLGRPADAVFARLTNPEARWCFETPEGAGTAFDTPEDGHEEVVVAPEGVEIDRMITDIRVLRGGWRVMVQGRGVFGGAVARCEQTTVEADIADQGEAHGNG